MNTTQLFNLKQAAMHLSAIQSDIEEQTNVYSTHSWDLVTDALSLITKLEETIYFEETTHPAER